MNDEEIAKRYGYGARIHKGALQVRGRVDLRHALDGPVSKAIQTLKKASQGLDEPRLEIDAEYKYGDPVTLVSVQGWRNATDEDRKLMVTQIESREQSRRARDEMELQRLKARRPDLFKATLPKLRDDKS